MTAVATPESEARKAGTRDAWLSARRGLDYSRMVIPAQWTSRPRDLEDYARGYLDVLATVSLNPQDTGDTGVVADWAFGRDDPNEPWQAAVRLGERLVVTPGAPLTIVLPAEWTNYPISWLRGFAHGAARRMAGEPEFQAPMRDVRSWIGKNTVIVEPPGFQPPAPTVESAPSARERARAGYDYGWSQTDRRLRGLPLPLEGPRLPEPVYDAWYERGAVDRRQERARRFDELWAAETAGDGPEVIEEFPTGLPTPTPMTPGLVDQALTTAKVLISTPEAPPPTPPGPASGGTARSGGGWAVALAAAVAAGGALAVALHRPKRRAGSSIV